MTPALEYLQSLGPGGRSYKTGQPGGIWSQGGQ